MVVQQPGGQEARRPTPRPEGAVELVPPQVDIANRLYPRAPDVVSRRSDANATDGHQSLIDRATLCKGNLRTESDLYVEGILEGELDCQGKLFVAEGARVAARVSARSVVVAGELEGDVTCIDRFEASPTARISGTLKTPQLVVHEGAQIDGRISMSAETTAAEMPPVRPPAATPPSAS